MMKILFGILILNIAWAFMKFECEQLEKVSPILYRKLHPFAHRNKVNSKKYKTIKETVLEEKEIH